MLKDLEQIKAWVKSNEYYLRNHTVDEIAELLIAMGFSSPTVAMWTCSEKYKRAG